MRVYNMHLLGDLGHVPPWISFLIIHSEITSEAIFSHKYHLTCMLASLLSTLFFYLDTSEFYVGTSPGMPGCSYATENWHAIQYVLDVGLAACEYKVGIHAGL